MLDPINLVRFIPTLRTLIPTAWIQGLSVHDNIYCFVVVIVEMLLLLLLLLILGANSGGE